MSNTRWSRLTRVVAGLRHAFAVNTHGPLTEADRKLLARLAMAIVLRRMTGPAILFLESLRPLNYIGSQAMTFLRPFLTPLFNRADYKRLAAVLERREGLRNLVEAIEDAAAKQPGGTR